MDNISYPSCIVNETEYVDYTQIPTVRYIIILVWSLMTVVTFLGNLFVILIIGTSRNMHTVTNYYLLNLAVTDLLIGVVVMPVKLVELAAPCHLNFFTHLTCKITQYIFMVLVFTSLLTLVVISIERYFAIVYPLNSRVFKSRTKTKVFIFLTWAIPVFVSLPFLDQTVSVTTLTSQYGSITRRFCADQFTPLARIIYILIVFLIYYLLPLGIISVTSCSIIRALLKPRPGYCPKFTSSSARGCVAVAKMENNKRKVAKMIVVIAIIYFISWTPFYLTNTVALVYNFYQQSNYFFIFLLLHTTAFLNSAANPLVYYFMSERMRLGLWQLGYYAIYCHKPPLSNKAPGYSIGSTTVGFNGDHRIHGHNGAALENERRFSDGVGLMVSSTTRMPRHRIDNSPEIIVHKGAHMLTGTAAIRQNTNGNSDHVDTVVDNFDCLRSIRMATLKTAVTAETDMDNETFIALRNSRARSGGSLSSDSICFLPEEAKNSEYM